MRPQKESELVGKRFGYLTILKQVSSKSRGTRWLCRCDCGNEKEVDWSNLQSGQTVSCNCGLWKKRMQAESVLSNALYVQYVMGAKKRGFLFNLAKEEVKELTTRKCHYCGSEPSTLLKRPRGTLLYNGIDRVDNTIGYLASNCVTCCKVCNFMKGTMSHQQFLEHVAKISKYNEDKDFTTLTTIS